MDPHYSNIFACLLHRYYILSLYGRRQKLTTEPSNSVQGLHFRKFANNRKRLQLALPYCIQCPFIFKVTRVFYNVNQLGGSSRNREFESGRTHKTPKAGLPNLSNGQEMARQPVAAKPRE